MEAAAATHPPNKWLHLSLPDQTISKSYFMAGNNFPLESRFAEHISKCSTWTLVMGSKCTKAKVTVRQKDSGSGKQRRCVEIDASSWDTFVANNRIKRDMVLKFEMGSELQTILVSRVEGAGAASPLATQRSGGKQQRKAVAAAHKQQQQQFNIATATAVKGRSPVQQSGKRQSCRRSAAVADAAGSDGEDGMAAPQQLGESPQVPSIGKRRQGQQEQQPGSAKRARQAKPPRPPAAAAEQRQQRRQQQQQDAAPSPTPAPAGPAPPAAEAGFLQMSEPPAGAAAEAGGGASASAPAAAAAPAPAMCPTRLAHHRARIAAVGPPRAAVDWVDAARGCPRAPEAAHLVLRPALGRVLEQVLWNLRSTIELGHNNSLLVQGDRGCGKTLVRAAG